MDWCTRSRTALRLFNNVRGVTLFAGCNYKLCIRVWLQRQSQSILQHWWLPTHGGGQGRWISFCAAAALSNKGQHGRSGSLQKQGSSTSDEVPHWQNTFITASRVMKEYLLSSEDIKGLTRRSSRTAYEGSDQYTLDNSDMSMYLKSDVEKRALQVWGSWENLAKEVEKRRSVQEEEEHRRRVLETIIDLLKKAKKDQSRQEFENQAFGGREDRVLQLKGSARVVSYAIMSNTAVMLFKLIAYVYTGSASMLSECVHSLADVLNQCLLAFGIAQSIRKPDPSHPYGFSRARYVYSLISGVGIFFLGSGVTIYHGIHGLIHPPAIQYLPAAFTVLLGSLLVEGATLITALKQVQVSARDSGVTFKEYVLRGRDPMAVAVLLEDSAAVSGVFLAASCLWLAQVTGNAMYDALGSIAIGGLLGAIALFLIQRNSTALVGRSIPAEKLKQITDMLESDRMIRSVHDVKATDMGADTVRFKAEINFDGREVARVHVARLDLEKLLKEVQGFRNVSEMEKFMLEHGDHVVDVLGSEVDRIEMKIKRKYPVIRHLDLEIL